MIFTDKEILCADSSEELHYFAGRVGLDPMCFSEGGPGAHYLLNGIEAVGKAIDGGAEVLERWKFCEKCAEGFAKV